MTDSTLKALVSSSEAYAIKDNDGRVEFTCKNCKENGGVEFICKNCKELRCFVTISGLKKHLCNVHNIVVSKAPPGPRPLISDSVERKEYKLQLARDYYYENRDEILIRKKTYDRQFAIHSLIEKFPPKKLEELYKKCHEYLENLAKEQEEKYKTGSTWIYGALLYEVDEDSEEGFPWSLSTREEYLTLNKSAKSATYKRALKWISLPQIKGKCYQLRRLWCALKLIDQKSQEKHKNHEGQIVRCEEFDTNENVNIININEDSMARVSSHILDTEKCDIYYY